MESSKGSAQWHQRFLVLPAGEDRPAILRTMADGAVPELVWRNELGGQTWRLGDRYLKWSPDSVGVDLNREVQRLRWLTGRYPGPDVLENGHDGTGSWFVSTALPAASAASPQWRSEPEPAVRAIAEGLRRLHALAVDDLPAEWESWATRRPPALGPLSAAEPPVVVHGDACAPNTLLGPDGDFAAIVDVGDLVLGDRWADLTVASMSLDWNFGPGWDACFFETYGVTPDEERMTYFRRLWDTES